MTVNGGPRVALLFVLLAAAAACDGLAVGEGEGEGEREGEGEGEGEGESSAAFALMVAPPPGAYLASVADSAAVLRLVDGTLLVAAQVASGTRVISPGDDAPPVEVPAGYDIAYIKIDPLSGAATTEIVDEGDADDTILASAEAADGTAWLAIAAGRTSMAETSPVIPPTVFLRRLAADGSRLVSVSYPISDGLSGAALGALADGGVVVHMRTDTASFTPTPHAAVVARLDASGDLVWAASLDGLLEAGGVVELEDGAVAIAGSQIGSVTVQGADGGAATIPCAHSTGAYLIVLTAEGAISRWATIDSDAIVGAPRLAAMPLGFVAAGYISGTVTLPGGTTIAPQGHHITWVARFGEDLIESWALSSTVGTAGPAQVRATANGEIWLLATTDTATELAGFAVPEGDAMWSARLGPDGAVRGVNYLESARQSWLVAASPLDADGHGHVAVVSNGDLATPLGPIELPSPSLVVLDDRALTPASPP